MQRVIALLRFVNIFSAAILAGGQLLVLRVIVPVKRQWSPKQSVEVHQAMLHTLPDSYLLPAGVISLVTGIVLLILQRGRKASTVFTLLGLVGSVGVSITSERFNKPTNRMILGWSSDSIPANYPQIRDRWDRVHAIRTASGLLSLISFLIAGMAER